MTTGVSASGAACARCRSSGSTGARVAAEAWRRCDTATSVVKRCMRVMPFSCLVARGEVPPVAVEREGQERAGRQLLRLHPRLEGRLEVEGALLEREIRLEDLFVE